MTQSPIETLQPEQSGGWIEHDGKGMPVDPRAIVSVRFRDGFVSNQTSVAKIWGEGGEESNWNHSEPSEWDIVAYRLHLPAPSSEPQPMTSHNAREPVEAIPEDIAMAARHLARQLCQFSEADEIAAFVAAKSEIIAKAILAERERCANIASHFMGSLWSSDQNHAASLIFNDIAHPAAPKTEG